MRSDRPSSTSSRHRKTHNHNGEIDKLDYHPGGRLLVPHHDEAEPAPRTSQETSYAGSFFEHVAEGVVDKDKARLKQEMVKYLSFVWAVMNCLCAGSITAYALYGPLFQTRLHYSQLQINGVSIAAELATYLPVPIFGVLCDRYGPGPSSALAGVLFGVGYILAAFTYRSGPPVESGGNGWPYAIMILAFIPIGMATSCMYMSAVATCAKNFGRGRFKGLALAVPIACFGLSGMWQSQLGTNLLYEGNPDGSKGPVDVFRYFIFLGSLFCVVGTIGFFTLQIVNEEDMIDEAVDELERSGLLNEDEFFRRTNPSYGAISTADDDDMTKSQLLERDEQQRKKAWLLNEETRRFLSDRNMWLLAAGFFFVTGPGEAFINNLGTILETLYTPAQLPVEGNPTSPTTQITVIALTSTIARILTGTLTDLLAPTVPPNQHRRGPNSLANSAASLGDLRSLEASRRCQLSRVLCLIVLSILLSVGQVVLASGLVQNHADRFWIVSACIGAGYGSVFSLTPIIVSVIAPLEVFATIWSCIATMPAISATVWGLIYSAVYQNAADATAMHITDASDALCFGTACYAPTFWAMSVSVWIACALWLFAWLGPDGWARRGIAV